MTKETLPSQQRRLQRLWRDLIDIASFRVVDRLAPEISGAAAWFAWTGVFVATLLVSGRPIIWSHDRRGVHEPFACKPHPESDYEQER